MWVDSGLKDKKLTMTKIGKRDMNCSTRELRDIGGSFWVCIGSCSSFRDGLDLASKEEGHLRPFKGLI